MMYFALYYYIDSFSDSRDPNPILFFSYILKLFFPHYYFVLNIKQETCEYHFYAFKYDLTKAGLITFFLIAKFFVTNAISCIFI